MLVPLTPATSISDLLAANSAPVPFLITSIAVDNVLSIVCTLSVNVDTSLSTVAIAEDNEFISSDKEDISLLIVVIAG